MNEQTIPIINISNINNDGAAASTANEIFKACTEHGFFYIKEHGVSVHLLAKIEALSRVFFSLPEAVKMEIAMPKAGKAWRGYFPLYGELTSGKPDRKEGLYFGIELNENDERVQKGIPLHGPNLFPHQPLGYRETILEYINAVTQVGHTVMKAISLSLGLPADYFYVKYGLDPLILFRIFHYPAQPVSQNEWGVGEHTDYGLLTILLQDANGGLQVESHGEWIDAPPIQNTFICNIGDMLEKMTGGLYRSTLHRVLNKSAADRLSFPLFFDPGFDTIIEPIENANPALLNTLQTRWDGTNVHQFGGTYGDYLISKVSKVFPDLERDVL